MTRRTHKRKIPRKPARKVLNSLSEAFEHPRPQFPGVAGPSVPMTLAETLQPIAGPSIIGVNKWPHQRDCLKRFGNPFTYGWVVEHLAHVVPPFAISMGSVHVASIPVNKIAADSLTRVLARIADACSHDPVQIAAGHCNCFSGSFALRNMRGLNTISMHAFGLAIDWDAGHNALGAKEEHTFFKPDSLLVQAFKSEGWIWGGDWRGRRDAMHVQAAIV
jgi:hypothetical protein